MQSCGVLNMPSPPPALLHGPCGRVHHEDTYIQQRPGPSEAGSGHYCQVSLRLPEGPEHRGWSFLCCGHQVHWLFEAQGWKKSEARRSPACASAPAPRYLDNIHLHPEEEKYQKIKLHNKVFQVRCGPGSQGPRSQGPWGGLQCGLHFVCDCLLLRPGVRTQYWRKCSCLSFQSGRIQACSTPPIVLLTHVFNLHGVKESLWGLALLPHVGPGMEHWCHTYLAISQALFELSIGS